jgi:cellulose synthase/poly-beta-1,6-N-acetylglucosamine synthase-like glycosyltransferase
MIDLEIPLGKRSRTYRFFEMLPAILSYGGLILMVVLSLVNPVWAAVYLLIIIITMVVKALGIAVHTIQGQRRLDLAQKVDWRSRLADLENPAKNYATQRSMVSGEFGFSKHLDNLRLMAADPDIFPRPSEIYNAVIIAAYNESIEVIEPTIQSVANTTYDNKNLIVVLAYEERGGAEIEKTAKILKKRFDKTFKQFHIVKHPADIPGEVVGKGGNITYAGKFLQQHFETIGLPLKDVIVTTLDSDNRPHPAYFDYVTYEYIVHENRKHLSYQPISIFTNNIWDAPAPMRVIATGNSFWNVISSMRPHTLRNFASHSQPMDALSEMDFWSTRTIVEDGHQYWRSYFYFGGNYAVIPIHVPIYQDAVMSDTLPKTLKAQFVQLRRWAYGASDIPYVATRVLSSKRNVPLGGGLARLVRLIDGHVTLAVVAILVSIGGWIPLLVNNESARSVAAHQLPEVISTIMQIATIGLFVTIFMSFKILPPRPERYKRRRTFGMILQWMLMPVTSIGYSALASLYSQGRLFMGKYLDKFDVTEKATAASVERAKAAKKIKKASKSA